VAGLSKAAALDQKPTFQPEVIDCSNGVPGATSKFVYIPTPLTWGAAEEYCINNYGTHLASIHSAYENECLASKVIPEGGDNQAWTGFTDNPPYSPEKLTFVWSDGTPDNYLNWNAGEPSDDPAEGCGRIYANNTAMSKDIQGKWNDDTCSKTAHFICVAERNIPFQCPGTDEDGLFTSLPTCPAALKWDGLSETEVQPKCEDHCFRNCGKGVTGIATLASPRGQGSTCVCYQQAYSTSRAIGRTPVGACTYASSAGQVVSQECSKALWRFPISSFLDNSFSIGFGFGGATSKFPFGTGEYDDSTEAQVRLVNNDGAWNFAKCLGSTDSAPCYSTANTQSPPTCNCEELRNHTETCKALDALPCPQALSFETFSGKKWTANNLVTSCIPSEVRPKYFLFT
jgi:hypothetical protein